MAFDWQSFLGANIGQIFKDIVSSFKVDPTIALQVQEKLQEAQLDLQAKIIDQVTAQVQVDLAEAQSKSTWVAGWRPFIGWVCGAGLCYQFLLRPLATGFLAMTHHPVVFPELQLESLMTLLGGMLGLGITGTVEKVATGSSTAH